MYTELSEFLEAFPGPLHHIKSKQLGNPFIFWSKNEADLDTPFNMIQDKIIDVFYNMTTFTEFLGQFWAPVTIGDRRLLSTSGQPFAIRHPSNEYAMYRLYYENYQYNIDVNKLDIEGDHIIKSGGPATAFLNRLPYMNELQWIPSEDSYLGESMNLSVMLPICFSSQNDCIGVLEFIVDAWIYDLGRCVLDTIDAVKKAGLDVFYVQDLIPYKTISGLKLVKDEIEEALKVVCESHNLSLAQVWIACEDKSRVLLSSSLEDIQMKRLLAIKLAGYFYAVTKDECNDLDEYIRLCDVTPRGIRDELPLETLQDYESRCIPKLRSDIYNILEDSDSEFFFKSSALAICLRSNDTGDFDYAFEFIWTKHSNFVIFLEALLLTLKRCLPRFKFASGAELGDELSVIVGGRARYVEHDEHGETGVIGETKTIKIFQGKRIPPMPKAPQERKKSMVVDCIAPSEVTCKTNRKVLPREVIEKQFGKTMKEAAKNLKVSLSTFKRNFKELDIPEWPGPNFVKRNKNDSSIIQINTVEEDNEAIQNLSTVNLDKNTLTLKAEYVDDMIKFHLPISQASFVTVAKEIGMKFKLSVGTYKLKYLDEDEDWISLTSDEEMSDCIKSSRKSDRVVVRLRVLPSPQLVSSGPGASFGIIST